VSKAGEDPGGRVLRLTIPIESDADRGVLRDAIASARAAELLKSHFVVRRAARAGGRCGPGSELELPDAVKRRLALLDCLAKALDDSEAGPA